MQLYEKSSTVSDGVCCQPSPYGEPVEPEQAPEAISRAVASLPPEQMFELMKQMKVRLATCLHNVYSVKCTFDTTQNDR